MTRLDGSHRLSNIDSVEQLAESFIETKEIDKFRLVRRIKQEKTLEKLFWDDMNKLGNRLYPRSSDWIVWPDVYQYLLQARHIMGGDVKKMSAYYGRTLASIRRERWPCYATTTVRWKGRELSWEQAHKKHVTMVAGYFGTLQKRHDAQIGLKLQITRIRTLDQFLKKNADVMQRFSNRQIIMHSPHMPEFIPRGLRCARQMPEVRHLPPLTFK